jgi:hypothetical protein
MSYLVTADHSGREIYGITVFALSDTGIMGSNPSQGMDVCLCLFCLC